MKIILVTAMLALTMLSVQAQQLSPEQMAAASLGQQIGLLSHENAVLRNQIQQQSAEIKTLKDQVKELSKK